MSKPVRFVFASDSHGDMADPEALDALWEFCKDYKPEVRVAGGDHFDLRALRRGGGLRKCGLRAQQQGDSGG